MTEIELRADALDTAFGADRPPLASVYLGGGTPSLLPADDARARCSSRPATVRHRAGRRGHARGEPGPDERGDLAALAGPGSTRLSFGAQSLDAGELRRLGRRHRAADVADAVAAARAAGIASISLDLLYDVPGQIARRRGSTTLDAALALGPDHLSLYALTLDDPDAEGLTGPGGDHLPTTPAPGAGATRARTDRTRTAPPTSTTTPSTGWRRRGWRGYEISNWARPGHESRHNLAYWQRRPYEAVGPGAHAFDGAHAALERRPPRRLPRRAPAGRRRPASLPPGGAETLDAGDGGGGDGSSSACGRIAGLPARGTPTSRHSATGVRLGPRRRAARRDDRRPDRPDDARPAAVATSCSRASSEAPPGPPATRSR